MPSVSTATLPQNCIIIEAAERSEDIYVTEAGELGNRCCYSSTTILTRIFEVMLRVVSFVGGDTDELRRRRNFSSFLDKIAREAEGEKRKRAFSAFLNQVEQVAEKGGFFYVSNNCCFEGGAARGLEPYRTLLMRMKQKQLCNQLCARIDAVISKVTVNPFALAKGVGSKEERAALHDSYVEVIQAIYCKDPSKEIGVVQYEAQQVLRTFVVDPDGFAESRENIKIGTYHLYDRLSIINTQTGFYSASVKEAIRVYI